MQIFLCWSGKVSHAIAQAMHTFLGDTIQELKPFLSSEDIRKGGRWSNEIGIQLADCNFGILCMTKDNLDARWILFEAGALSKLPNSHVTALLAGIQSTDITPPLSQFQHTGISRAEILKLLEDINGLLPEEKRLDSARLIRVFDSNWPAVNDSLTASLKLSEGDAPAVQRRSTENMVEELLDLVREMKRESEVNRSTPGLGWITTGSPGYYVPAAGAYTQAAGTLMANYGNPGAAGPVLVLGDSNLPAALAKPETGKKPNPKKSQR